MGHQGTESSLTPLLLQDVLDPPGSPGTACDGAWRGYGTGMVPTWYHRSWGQGGLKGEKVSGFLTLIPTEMAILLPHRFILDDVWNPILRFVRSLPGFNAEAQRIAKKRREKELSANLCESLRLCVKTGLALLVAAWPRCISRRSDACNLGAIHTLRVVAHPQGLSRVAGRSWALDTPFLPGHRQNELSRPLQTFFYKSACSVLTTSPAPCKYIVYTLYGQHIRN